MSAKCALVFYVLINFGDAGVTRNRRVCGVHFYADPYLWREIVNRNGNSVMYISYHFKRASVFIADGNATKSHAFLDSITSDLIASANSVYYEHFVLNIYSDGVTVDKSECNDVYDLCEEHPELPVEELCRRPVRCSENKNYFCNDIKSMR